MKCWHRAGQAEELGISVIVIAGGEPLVRIDEILAIAAAHPALLFPVFTNGLLISEPVADRIAGCRNIVPVLSFEGFREETDLRGGEAGSLTGCWRSVPVSRSGRSFLAVR